jgi:hypothetical protein
MTSYTWKGVSGDWNLASDWTPAGGPPKSTDSATINGTATDTITVDTADVANSLTLSDANATLNDDGSSASLTIGGTLTMSNGALNLGDGGSLTVGALKLSGGALTVYSGGQLNLNGTLSQTGGTLTLDGGTISGGTIDSTAGTLAFTRSGGTLSGVTFDGPLDLTGYDESTNLASGTTVVGASGSGPGTINDTGYSSKLYVDNAQTVSNATINLGNTTGYAFLEEYDIAGAGGQVLTLASGVTVDVQGNAQIDGSGFSGDGIVNEGAIDVTGGGDLNIASNNFTNEGTISVEDSTEDIEPTTFATTASSVIEIEGDSYLTIDPTNPWTNLGSITLASGASLYLYGTVSAASLGTISNSGGTVYIGGTWNNFGQTLNGSASFGELALYGGTISGGTVTSAGLAFTISGTLSGVTYDGPLNLTAFGQAVDLASGTTVVGPSGSGPGTINDTGNSSELFFDNTQTVSNDTINLGTTSAFYSSFLFDNDTAGAGDQVLTLASSVTVDVAGTASIGSGDSPGDGIVNKGVIDQTGRSGGLLISGNAFTNSGTIDAKATDGYLDIDPTTFINSGKIHVANGDIVRIEPTVTGKGTDTISGDSTLEFDAGVSSAKTLGDQDIDFTGGGTLHLLAPKSFYGEISDFGTGDTVELLGSWHFSAISHSGDVTTLTLAKGSTSHAFEFAGDHTRSDFTITPGTTTKIAYA